MTNNWMESLTNALGTPAGYLGLGSAVAVGVVSAAYILTRPTPVSFHLDYDNQAVLLEGGVLASPYTAKTGKLRDSLYDDIKTVHDLFLRGKRITGNGKFLGSRTGPNRQYEWKSYNDVFHSVLAFGSGLLQIGVEHGQKTFLGIFAQNRPEWVVAELTCQMFSMVSVALYDTLGAEAVTYIIKLCEIQAVLCDTEARVQLLLDQHSNIPMLKTIVIIESVSDKLKEAAKTAGLNIVTMLEVQEMGQRDIQDPLSPQPSDISTVCFTSGTTGGRLGYIIQWLRFTRTRPANGLRSKVYLLKRIVFSNHWSGRSPVMKGGHYLNGDPKGVILTHSNFIAALSGVLERTNIFHTWSPDDCHLSYLPLSHLYERMNVFGLMTYGGHIGFYSRDILLLLDDLQTLKPTVFMTVPRILNRIRDKVISSVESSKLKKFLLDWALKSKLSEVHRGIIRRNSIWDTLIFGKIQNFLGGRVKFVVVGSAPLSAEVHDFIRCALGCLVFEAYGQTECTACATVQLPGDVTSGHVGCPMSCNYIKLIDVPEMNYRVADGIGEVCVKGTNVMVGYYKNPEKTMEAFTTDGWLRTGDVGIFQANGTLKITDRCKHIFKLSQGEYITPERNEAIYCRSKYVQQCFVDGSSLESRCVGIVVPEPEVVQVWATNNNKPKDLNLLCSDETLKDVILKDMIQFGKTAGLKGFEQVMDIALHPEPFSLEAGLLTPTFKNKRAQLSKHFAHKVAAIYAKHKHSA